MVQYLYRERLKLQKIRPYAYGRLPLRHGAQPYRKLAKKEYQMMGNWKVLVIFLKVDNHYRIVQTFFFFPADINNPLLE